MSVPNRIEYLLTNVVYTVWAAQSTGALPFPEPLALPYVLNNITGTLQTGYEIFLNFLRK